MKLAYVTDAPPQSGMGKPARAILDVLRKTSPLAIDFFMLDGTRRELMKNETPVKTLSALPGPFSAKPFQWWRLSKHLPKTGYNLWHLTNQTLSFIPRQPFVLTVYDLIERLDPQEALGGPVARFLYRGISEAAHVICISDYTKKTVQELYHIPDERISIIPLGVASTFSAVPDVKTSIAYHTFLQEQRLPSTAHIVLYVGSDHPRKNLRMLAEAFARVRQVLPDTVLLKVGDPGLLEGREQFLKDLDQLRIRDAVRFLSNVGEEQLRFLYSVADVFAFPSTFEGFGIPPLEAMACGCPVVVSNATSLPEVVGDAGIQCGPNDIHAFADGMLSILTNSDRAKEFRAKGIARAPQFFWESIAEKTARVYQKVLDNIA